MAQKYRKNTVPGTQRGRKWPPEKKAACMAALLLTDNLSAVAQAHGVPESTLRTWQKEARKEGAASVWARAREAAARQIAYRASEGARLEVEYLVRRVEAASRAEDAMEDIRAELRALGPSTEGEAPDKTAQRMRLMQELGLWRGMSDATAANLLRTLVSVEAKAGGRAGSEQSGAQSYEAALAACIGDEF